MPTPIPGPPGVPLLGNVFDVNPNETWNSLNKLAKQFGKSNQKSQISHACNTNLEIRFHQAPFSKSMP
jgi:hypothetical protein